MPPTKKPAKPRRSRGTATRSARELDQLELIATMHKADEEGRTKLRTAIVDAFSCDSGRALVAFGKLLQFVAQPRGRR